jgi:hypothetical protein
MPEHEPLDYRLRCHTKRTDLPSDVLRDIGEAYETIQRLTKERDEARKNVLGLMHPDSRHGYITAMEWDCFNTPEAKVDKTLNGVIVYGGKAVPPKYEDLGDE